MKVETGSCGKSAPSTMATPVVPPNARWFGVLKSTIATAVRMRPRFSMRKKLSLP